ncbi:hypothetical protein E4T48_01199 [Aureobasidium sp. EXF-10727]|nr:hypothetical protein E4T48_01199 [Aureobasidium sp. EXF-10727]
MDDEDFISGYYGQDCPKDSDIILKCGDHQWYAHRVILRLWSPFFDRSLNSGFSVAKSAIFNIDHDEPADHEAFEAMLKHVYGMPFGEHVDNDGSDYEYCITMFDHSIEVYKMADKYDVPSVRRAAIQLSITYLEDNSPFNGHSEMVRVTSAESIASICGPDAPKLADPAMRDALFDWVVKHFDLINEKSAFSLKIKDGTLFDTELTAKLLIKLGVQIGALKRKQQSESSFVGRRR